MKVFMAAVVGLGLLAISATADGQDAKAAPKAGGELKDLNAKVSYSIGVNLGLDIARRIKSQPVDIDNELLAQGFRDALAGKPKLTDEQMRETMNEFQKVMEAKAGQIAEKAKKEGEAVKKEGDAFLAANQKKPGIKTTPSGLQYEVLREGTGRPPSATDKVTVNYEGRRVDGVVFDSSYKRGEPLSIGVNQVIKGWTEGLQLMKPGSKYRFFIPSELAYGPRSQGAIIRGNETLIFDVELLKVN
jgi:FKBP-type peptidyl-prolyl cis-trans isomerase